MGSSGQRADGAARHGRGDSGICVGIVSERRYLVQAQPMGLRDALVAAGHRVRLIDADAEVRALGDATWLVGLDVVVARGRSWPVLALLAMAESWAIPTLNPRGAIAGVHNKADMTVMLAAAGVPTPTTYLGAPATLGRAIAAAQYPVIVKPIFGDNGQGLRVVGSAAELEQLAWLDAPVLAQHFVASDGWDLKLYGIGDEIRAVRKPSPLLARAAEPAAAEPVAVTPALARLGRSCGTLFGLDLYGVDCVETSQGPVVIEVNEFPNYTAVEHASERLAAYVVGWTSGAEERR